MRKNRVALSVSGLIGLGLAFGLMTRALSTGSYWQYLGTLALLVLSIRLFVNAVRNG